MTSAPSTWASGTADYFRTVETSQTTEIHELELNNSTIEATLAAKRSMLAQQDVSADRSENELREIFTHPSCDSPNTSIFSIFLQLFSLFDQCAMHSNNRLGNITSRKKAAYFGKLLSI
jgi:hypothetical protein